MEKTNKSSQSIAHWAEEDRPREKLERLGAQALSNAELLGILIGSGSANESAVALMHRVLVDCDNNLNTLGKLSIHQLQQYKGLGPAKAITILAACELGKRRASAKIQEREKLDSPELVYQYLHPYFQDKPIEEAWVVLMNHNFKVIKSLCLSRGGLSETAVDVRLLVKEALLANATVVALAHNHPSNNLKPSKADDLLTKQVKDACNFMRLYFLDHLIITDGAFFSYRDEGLL